MPTSGYYPPGADLRFTMLSATDETRLFREAREGNEESRVFLIQNHMLFAAMHARKLSKGRLPDEDVLSGANLALMKAFKGFQYERGSRFTSYLKPFIQGEISALWRKYYEDLATGSGAETIPDSASNPHEEVIEKEHSRFLISLIAEFKNVLNPHEQEIIDRHYLKSESFADIARSRGVSREAIRASHARAIVKLKKAFKRRGITNSK
jgi:RNA polymerase sigma factor (sigma-70 family)